MLEKIKEKINLLETKIKKEIESRIDEEKLKEVQDKEGDFLGDEVKGVSGDDFSQTNADKSNNKETLKEKNNFFKIIFLKIRPSKLKISFWGLQLAFWEFVYNLFKIYFLIFGDPATSFLLFFKNKGFEACNYSYVKFKIVQKRIKAFSLIGLSTLISATVIVSLILNLATGPIQKSRAATYYFTQTTWSGGESTTLATHQNDQSGWTYYGSKDSNLTINADGNLELSTSTATWTQTTDSDFNTGDDSNTEVSNNSVVLLNTNKNILFGTTNKHNANFGGRSGADSFCQNNMPSGLTCDNIHAFLGVNSSDEIRDMPNNYGYDTTYPIYLFDSTNLDFVFFSNTWSDMLNNNVDVAPSVALGSIISWTGSDVGGALSDCDYWLTCDNWTMSDHVFTNRGGFGHSAYKDLTCIAGTDSAYYHWLWATYGEGTSCVSDVCAQDSAKAYYCDETAYLYCFCQKEGYYSSGTYTSVIYDTGVNQDFLTLNYNASLPSGTNISIKVRSCDDSACSSEPDFSSCTAISSGEDISDNACVNDGDKYVQYQASLSTADTTITPSLDDITINYLKYYSVSAQSLISSKYDAFSDGNVMGGVKWTEDTTLPDNTQVTMYLRTASSSDDLDSAIWYEVASSTPNYLTDGCTKASSTGEVFCLSSVIPSALKDGLGDRYFQYKISLSSSNGDYTPTVSSVSVIYVVNANPELNPDYLNSGGGGFDVSLATSTNTFTMSYSVRDIDTTTGTAQPGYVTPSFQYSVDGGSNWVDITSGLSAGATDNKAVQENTYTEYSATWDPKSMLDDSYYADFRLKIILVDGEAANNTASAESSSFILDTTDPSFGSPASLLYATSTPALITLSAIDNSNLYMKIGLESDLSDVSSWTDYNSTSTISLATNPDTVYYQLKDEYGNTTTIGSITSVETPSYAIIQDVSNLNIPNNQEYALFLAWKVVDEPTFGFNSYRIYYSDDGSNYSLLHTITDKSINYYRDSSVNFDVLRYYKLITKDNNGNVSIYSSVLEGKANGTQDAGEGGGGTESTAPTISNVNIDPSKIYSTQATITWDTNELSDSSVEYIATSTGDFSNALSQGVSSMLNNDSGVGHHSVTLTGLIPGKTYYIRVKSTDLFGNTATYQNGIGDSFTTQSGVVISSTTVQSVNNSGATIVWTSSAPVSSYVVYSKSPSVSTSTTQVGSAELTTEHSVTLSNLDLGQTYYFYVKSSDASANVTVDNNGGNYYYFTTTSDNSPPMISGVDVTTGTDTATIVWTTNELANSKMEYASASYYQANSSYSNTASSSTYTIQHSIVIEGLASSTTYHYRLTSSDQGGNTAQTNDLTFTTAAPRSVECPACPACPTCPTCSGGSSILPITCPEVDEEAPVISNIGLKNLSETSVDVEWSTNEEANGLLSYALDNSFENNVLLGRVDLMSLSHLISLNNLSPGTVYYYKIYSRDQSGNLAESEILNFKTKGKKKETVADADKAIKNNLQKMEEDLEKNKGKDADKTLSESLKKINELILKFKDSLSIEKLEKAFENSLKSVDNLIPAPKILGNPLVDFDDGKTIISWKTDKKANSVVFFVSEKEFNPSSENPYIYESGNRYDMTTDHKVVIPNLKPGTTYYFEVLSKPLIGQELKVSNLSFTTPSEVPRVEEADIVEVTDNSATIVWTTNIPTDSLVRYIPFDTASQTPNKDKVKIQGKDELVKSHRLTIKNLQEGTTYAVYIEGKSEQGDRFTYDLGKLSTGKDIRPPHITDVKSESSLLSGDNNKIQTIIFFNTDEKSYTQVAYIESFNNNKLNDENIKKAIEEQKQVKTATGTPQEKTFFYSKDTGITLTPLAELPDKEHIVIINKFKPNTAYAFRAIAFDSSDNLSISKNYVLLTPQKNKTVFDMIIKTFESRFGWLKKMR